MSGKNTEKCINFSVSIEKQKYGKNIKYKLRLINNL